jgi:hypothetical protein
VNTGTLVTAFAMALAGAVLLKLAESRGASAAAVVTPSPMGPTQGSGAVPAGVSSKLNANQSAFAGELAKQTGLDPTVIGAWLLSEEPASASQAPNGANNWLNIGAFDSGDWAGGSNAVWDNPITAADATAAWLHGADSLGIGAASPGIQGILQSVGGSAQQQIQAIQGSGWASSGYPELTEIYDELAG